MASGQFLDVLHYLRRLAAPASASSTDAELLNQFITRRDADAFAALVQRTGRWFTASASGCCFTSTTPRMPSRRHF